MSAAAPLPRPEPINGYVNGAVRPAPPPPRLSHAHVKAALKKTRMGERAVNTSDLEESGLEELEDVDGDGEITMEDVRAALVKTCRVGDDTIQASKETQNATRKATRVNGDTSRLRLLKNKQQPSV